MITGDSTTNCAAPGGARQRGRQMCGLDEPCPPNAAFASAARFVCHLPRCCSSRHASREAASGATQT